MINSTIKRNCFRARIPYNYDWGPLLVEVHFRSGTTSGSDPLPVGTHFRFGPHVQSRSTSQLGSTSGLGILPVKAQTGRRCKPEMDPNSKSAQTRSRPQKNHPKMQRNILLHSSMITPDIGLDFLLPKN